MLMNGEKFLKWEEEIATVSIITLITTIIIITIVTVVDTDSAQFQRNRPTLKQSRPTGSCMIGLQWRLMPTVFFLLVV